MSDFFIAFWNVENLFDVEASPRRSEKLERTLRGELAGWTQTVLDRKVAQLASVIGKMNEGAGPDLLSVCEIENEHVLQLLTTALAPLGRRYDIAHDDATDGRGIDVAFIYDADLFEARERFMHVIVKRVATREIFQVNFVLKGTQPEKLLVVVGNHWPSRLGGMYESEPYRIVAAETLAYFHERIREVHGSDVAVLAMGDFNDEPYRRSLVDHALSESARLRVTRATSGRLWNLMWPLLGQGLASHFHENEGALIDQFLVSRGLTSGSSGIEVLPESVRIISSPEMTTGPHGAPRRFGRGANPDEDGFSDHFPISLRVRA